MDQKLRMTSCYQRLEEGSFRLLTFLDDGGLSCRMQSYPLDSAPSFIALSYTWGRASYQKGRPSSRTYSIVLDGEQFPVQQNLYDALTHLAKAVRRRGCLFWIDAVCINQPDTQERNAQVRIMKDIYEKAEEIYAWLGVPFNEDETRLAVELMRRFNRYLYDGLKEHHDDIDKVGATITIDHFGFPAHAGSETWTAWDGIAEMFNQPYWHRTWIYQEATTPGRIMFHCGEHKFDDIVLAATVYFAKLFAKMSRLNLRFGEAAGGGSSVSALVSARMARESGSKRGLFDLLSELKKTRCSNPRDKIYAALGHAADVGTHRIPIDYDRSVVDVYIDLVKAALADPKTVGLSFLGLVGTSAEEASDTNLRETFDPPVPSWVPDWRQRITIPPITQRAEHSDVLYEPGPSACVDARVRGRELEVKGIVFKELWVEELAPVWDSDRKLYTIARPWLANGTCKPPDFVSDLDDAVRRSVVGDRSFVPDVPDDRRWLWRCRRGNTVEWKLLDMKHEQLELSLQSRRDEMIEEMRFVSFGRRLGKLSDGSVATLPAAAKIGDQIALFHGGGALYLIRPAGAAVKHEGEHHFIGECYVDGLMDGALMDTGVRCGKTAGFIRLV